MFDYPKRTSSMLHSTTNVDVLPQQSHGPCSHGSPEIEKELSSDPQSTCVDYLLHNGKVFLCIKQTNNIPMPKCTQKLSYSLGIF